MPQLDRGTLVAQSRKELLETGTTSGQWDDTELIEFLQEANESITEIAEKEITATGQTVAGQESVDYPATVGKVLGIWSRRSGSGGDWLKLRKMEIDERQPLVTASGSGAPSAYMIFNGKIYLSPIPSDIFDISIMGYMAASDLIGGTDATVPVFDSRFHHLLRYYCVARAKQKMDDPGYVNYDALFMAGITGLRVSKLSQKEQEGPKMPKMVTGMWD